MTEYATWTLSQLTKLLREKSLKVAGNKKQVLSRIKRHLAGEKVERGYSTKRRGKGEDDGSGSKSSTKRPKGSVAATMLLPLRRQLGLGHMADIGRLADKVVARNGNPRVDAAHVVALSHGETPRELIVQPIHAALLGPEDTAAASKLWLVAAAAWDRQAADVEPVSTAVKAPGSDPDTTPQQGMDEAAVNAMVKSAQHWQVDVPAVEAPSTPQSNPSSPMAPIPALAGVRPRGGPLRRMDNWGFVDSATGEAVSLWEVMEALAKPVPAPTAGGTAGGGAAAAASTDATAVAEEQGVQDQRSFVLHGTLVSASPRFSALSNPHIPRVVLPVRNVGFPRGLQNFPKAPAKSTADEEEDSKQDAEDADGDSKMSGADTPATAAGETPQATPTAGDGATPAPELNAVLGGTKRPREEPAPVPTLQLSAASKSVKAKAVASPDGPSRQQCHEEAIAAVKAAPLPLPFGAYVVLHESGDIVTDPARMYMFHNSKYVFPVGWTLKRSFASYMDLSKRTKYTCIIKDGGDAGPVFRIEVEDDEANPIEAETAGAAWKIVGERVQSAQAASGSKVRTGATINGAEYFGYGSVRLLKYIECKPECLQMPEYVFHSQRADAAPTAAATTSAGPAASSASGDTAGQSSISTFFKPSAGGDDTARPAKTARPEGAADVSTAAITAEQLQTAVCAQVDAAVARGEQVSVKAVREGAEAHLQTDLGAHKDAIQAMVVQRVQAQQQSAAGGAPAAAASAAGPLTAAGVPVASLPRLNVPQVPSIEQLMANISPAAATAAASANPQLAAAARSASASAPNLPLLVATQMYMARMQMAQLLQHRNASVRQQLLHIAKLNGGIIPPQYVNVATSVGLPGGGRMSTPSLPGSGFSTGVGSFMGGTSAAPTAERPSAEHLTPEQRMQFSLACLSAADKQDWVPPPRLALLNPETWSTSLPRGALNECWAVWKDTQAAAGAVLAAHQEVLAGPREPVSITGLKEFFIEYTPTCPVLWVATESAWYALTTLACDTLPCAAYEPLARRALSLFQTSVAVLHASYLHLALRMRVSSAEFFKVVARWTARRAVAISQAQQWLLLSSQSGVDLTVDKSSALAAPSDNDDDDDEDLTLEQLTDGPPVPPSVLPFLASVARAGGAAALGGSKGRLAHFVLTVPSLPGIIADGGLFALDQIALYDAESAEAHASAKKAASDVVNAANETGENPRPAAAVAIARAGSACLPEPAAYHRAEVGLHARTAATQFAGVRKVLEMGQSARLSAMRADAKAEGRVMPTAVITTGAPMELRDPRDTPLFRWFAQLAKLAEEPSTVADPLSKPAVQDTGSDVQLTTVPALRASPFLVGVSSACSELLVQCWHFLTLFHVPLGMTAVSLPDFVSAMRYRGGDSSITATVFMRLLYVWHCEMAREDVIAGEEARVSKLKGKAHAAAIGGVPAPDTPLDALPEHLAVQAAARVPSIHAGTWQELLRSWMRGALSPNEADMLKQSETLDLAVLLPGASEALAAAANKALTEQQNGSKVPDAEADHVMGLLPGSALGAVGVDPSVSFDVQSWGIGGPAFNAPLTHHMNTVLTAGSKVKRIPHQDAEGCLSVLAPPPEVFTTEGQPLGELMSHCATLLGCIMTHFRAKPFLQPVSLPEAPKYHEIVGNPMDLGTIKERIFSGYYVNKHFPINTEPTFEDGTPRPQGAAPGSGHRGFLTDMRLTWNNCIMFNGEGTPVGRAAVDLGWAFESLYGSLIQPMALEATAERVRAEEAEAEAAEAAEAAQAEADLLAEEGATAVAAGPAAPIKPAETKAGSSGVLEADNGLPTVLEVVRALGSVEFKHLPLSMRLVCLKRLMHTLVGMRPLRLHAQGLRRARNALARDVEQLGKARAAAKRTHALCLRLQHVWGAICAARYAKLGISEDLLEDEGDQWARGDTFRAPTAVPNGGVDTVALARKVRPARAWDNLASRYHSASQNLSFSRPPVGRGSIPPAPTHMTREHARKFLQTQVEQAGVLLSNAPAEALAPPSAFPMQMAPPASPAAEEAAWRRRANALMLDSVAAAECVSACDALLVVAWDKLMACSPRPAPLFRDGQQRDVWWFPTSGCSSATPLFQDEVEADMAANTKEQMGAATDMEAARLHRSIAVAASDPAASMEDALGASSTVERNVVLARGGGGGFLMVDTSTQGHAKPTAAPPLAVVSAEQMAALNTQLAADACDATSAPARSAAWALRHVVSDTLVKQSGFLAEDSVQLLRSAGRMYAALHAYVGPAAAKVAVADTGSPDLAFLRQLAAIPGGTFGQLGVPRPVTATHVLHPASARARALLASTTGAPIATRAELARLKNFKSGRSAVPGSSLARLLAALREGTVWPDWAVAMSTAGEAEPMWARIGSGVSVQAKATVDGVTLSASDLGGWSDTAAVLPSAFVPSDPSLSLALVCHGERADDSTAAVADAFEFIVAHEALVHSPAPGRPTELTVQAVDAVPRPSAKGELGEIAWNDNRDPGEGAGKGAPRADVRAALQRVDYAADGYSLPPPELGAWARYGNTADSDLEDAAKALQLARAARVFLAALAAGHDEAAALGAVEASRAGGATVVTPDEDDNDGASDDDDDDEEEEEGATGEQGGNAASKAASAKAAAAKAAAAVAAATPKAGSADAPSVPAVWTSLADALQAGYVCDPRWLPTGDTLSRDGNNAWIPSLALLSEGFLFDNDSSRALVVLPSQRGPRQQQRCLMEPAGDGGSLRWRLAEAAAVQPGRSDEGRYVYPTLGDDEEDGVTLPPSMELARRHALYTACASLEVSPAAAAQYSLLQLDLRLSSATGLATWAVSHGRHVWRARVAAAEHVATEYSNDLAQQLLTRVAGGLSSAAFCMAAAPAGEGCVVSATAAQQLTCGGFERQQGAHGGEAGGILADSDGAWLLDSVSLPVSSGVALDAIALGRLVDSALKLETVLAAEGGAKGVVHPAWPESRAAWRRALSACRTFSQLGVLVERLTVWGVLWEVVEGGRASLVGAVQVDTGAGASVARGRRPRVAITYDESPTELADEAAAGDEDEGEDDDGDVQLQGGADAAGADDGDSGYGSF